MERLKNFLYCNRRLQYKFSKFFMRLLPYNQCTSRARSHVGIINNVSLYTINISNAISNNTKVSTKMIHWSLLIVLIGYQSVVIGHTSGIGHHATGCGSEKVRLSTPWKLLGNLSTVVYIYIEPMGFTQLIHVIRECWDLSWNFFVSLPYDNPRL